MCAVSKALDAIDALPANSISPLTNDAGAGYASMRHILSVRPDIIKLDISLTRSIDKDRTRHALAAALIEFARQTGSSVLTEGVENARL